MTDSANSLEACACGGYRVITPARLGTDAKFVHLTPRADEAPCPKDA
ncbi:hypothetical protein [Streptomyces echinatus]